MNTNGSGPMQDVTAVVSSISGGATAYTAGDVIARNHESAGFIANNPNLPVILQVVGAIGVVFGIILGLVRAYQNHLDRQLKRGFQRQILLADLLTIEI